MSRRLPLCARCGKSMKGTSRVVLGWDGVPGKPSLGWHMYDGHDCLEKDRDAAATATATYLDSERIPVVIDVYDRERIYPCRKRRAKA